MKNLKISKIALLLLFSIAIIIGCSKKKESQPEQPKEDFTPPTDFAGMPEPMRQFAVEYGAMPTVAKTIFAPSDITPIIKTGESVYSPNQNYRLTIINGDLILYKKNGTVEETLWSSGTSNSQSLFFQTDGNLVLYKGLALGSGAAWDSKGIHDAVGGLNKINGDMAIYALQDDGDFVYYWKHTPTGKTPRKWTLAATDTKGGIVSSHLKNINHIVK